MFSVKKYGDALAFELAVEARYRGQQGEICGDLLIEDENEIRENGGKSLHGTGQAPARGVRSQTGPRPKYGPSITQATGKAPTPSGRGDATSGGKAES